MLHHRPGGNDLVSRSQRDGVNSPALPHRQMLSSYRGEDQVNRARKRLVSSSVLWHWPAGDQEMDVGWVWTPSAVRAREGWVVKQRLPSSYSQALSPCLGASGVCIGKADRMERGGCFPHPSHAAGGGESPQGWEKSCHPNTASAMRCEARDGSSLP